MNHQRTKTIPYDSNDTIPDNDTIPSIRAICVDDTPVESPSDILARRYNQDQCLIDNDGLSDLTASLFAYFQSKKK